MWDSIKKLLKTNKDKAVLMENGEPKYVILSVDEYLKLSGEAPAQNRDTPEPEEVFTDYYENEDFNFTDAMQDELASDIDLSDIETQNPSEYQSIADENPGSISLDDLPIS
ncbi:MAG: hypothetical protein WD712_02030 [Candidatus Spechtbacterales bacterium]